MSEAASEAEYVYSGNSSHSDEQDSAEMRPLVRGGFRAIRASPDIDTDNNDAGNDEGVGDDTIKLMVEMLKKGQLKVPAKVQRAVEMQKVTHA